jgi:hypothetical protein
MKMNKEQRKFLENELYSLSLKAANTRNSIYEKHAEEKEKENFNTDLKKEIIKYAEKYKEEISENDHYKNIVEISRIISDKHSTILINKRYRIGNSQKLLNMYLKYLWCIELVKLPPHMPVDGKILETFKERHKSEKNQEKRKNIKILDTKWTAIDSIEKYREIIECIKQFEIKNSLAEEELEMWNKKSSQI